MCLYVTQISAPVQQQAEGKHRLQCSGHRCVLVHFEALLWGSSFPVLSRKWEAGQSTDLAGVTVMSQQEIKTGLLKGEVQPTSEQAEQMTRWSKINP